MTDSFLHEQIEGYLHFRRGLGYRAIQDHFQLRIFEREVVQHGLKNLSEIDSTFIMRLSHEHLKSKMPQTVNRHLGVLSNLFQYLQRLNACETNPLSDRAGFPSLYFSPYVFSDNEIKRILEGFAVDTANCPGWGHFMPRLSRYCAFTLIARCGLRISESCQLRMKDFSPSEGTIFIEKTKFRKDRKIPIPKSVVQEMVNYVEVRKHHHLSKESQAFFITAKGRPYSRKTLGHFFRLKVQELGIYRSSFVRGNTIFGSPSPHSLRHSFAVRTIRRWQALGLPIDQISDTLATYMGHVNFCYTLEYLKALSSEPGILIFKPPQ